MSDIEDDDFNYSEAEEDSDDGQSLSEDDGIPFETNDNNSTESKEETECVVLSPDLLEKEMELSISDVASILDVSRGTCRILLHKYKWNKESLLEKFYESRDTNEFLLKAQIEPKKRIANSTGECDVCCITGNLVGMGCNHRACTDCWKQYLTTKIVADCTSEVECIASGCKLLLEDEMIESFLTDSHVKSVYRRLVVSSFVNQNKLIRWCPGVDCQKALKVSHCEPRLAVCSCGARFCFFCGNDWHEPVNCRLLKLWLKKCADDSETSNWINANTKECPKCQIIIEKDGGCNHMTCKNSACRFEFCWMCLGPWEPHGSSWYSCNRYDDSAAKQARDAQEISRANLQRYLFYYNRYVGHQQSLKLEGKLYATVKSKMEQMQQLSMSWIEVQFLKKAVDVLSECRRTLMFTYAFAYYLKKDNNSMIFEDNQKDLEMETERLSEFLERDLDNENLVTLKQKVQDKYRYVQHRRKILLNHCQEGTERDMWNYNE